jgi:hypothetical protein
MELALGTCLTNLRECAQGTSGWDPAGVIEDIEQICLRDVVSEDDIATSSDSILDKEEGILSYVELTRGVSGSKKARERVFEFVAKFIKEVVKERVLPYVFGIQEVKLTLTLTLPLCHHLL